MARTIGLAGQQHARSGRAGGLPLAVSRALSGAAPAAGISVYWLLVDIRRACPQPRPPGRALVPVRRGLNDSGRMFRRLGPDARALSLRAPPSAQSEGGCSVKARVPLKISSFTMKVNPSRKRTASGRTAT